MAVRTPQGEISNVCFGSSSQREDGPGVMAFNEAGTMTAVHLLKIKSGTLAHQLPACSQYVVALCCCHEASVSFPGDM